MTAEPSPHLSADLQRGEDGRMLDVTLPSGERLGLAAARLRQACRCAQCRRTRFDGGAVGTIPTVTIVACTPVGHYGVNIAFSDGHARGIYPWDYLRELASA